MEYTPPPPPPITARSTPTGWIIAVVALGVVLLLAAAIALMTVSSKNTEIGGLRDDIAEASRTVENLEDRSSGLENDLEAARNDIESLRNDLESTQRALGTATACAQAAMRAWTSTLTDSYGVTGFALGRVFTSPPCKEFRRNQSADASLL